MKKAEMTKREKVFVSVASVLLALLLLTAVILGVTLPQKKGSKPELDGVSLMSSQIERADYAKYGISPMAESAWTIKATYTGEVVHKELDWELYWAGGEGLGASYSTGWGNGKTPSEYVKISPSSDTLTLTVSLLQPFGEQLIIRARNHANPMLSKTATVDYARRITAVSVTFTGKGGTFTIDEHNSTVYDQALVSGSSTDKMTYEINYTYSDIWSVEDSFSVTKFHMKALDSTVNGAKEYAQSNGLYQGSWSIAFDDIIETEFDLLTNAPDLTVKESLLETAFDGAGDDMLAIFGGYWQENAESMQGTFALYLFELEVTGTYSNYKASSSDKYSDWMNFRYGPNTFSDILGGQFTLDSTSFVF